MLAAAAAVAAVVPDSDLSYSAARAAVDRGYGGRHRGRRGFENDVCEEHLLTVHLGLYVSTARQEVTIKHN